MSGGLGGGEARKMHGDTRPAPLLSPLRQPRTHRIERNVTRSVEQMCLVHTPPTQRALATSAR
jgi:hypothetical protein